MVSQLRKHLPGKRTEQKTEEKKEQLPPQQHDHSIRPVHEHIPNIYDELRAHSWKYKHGRVPCSMISMPYADPDEIVTYFPDYICDYEGEGCLVPPFMQYYRDHTPTLRDALWGHSNHCHRGQVHADMIYNPHGEYESYFADFGDTFDTVFHALSFDQEFLKEMEIVGAAEANKKNGYPEEKIYPKWAREVDDWDKYEKRDNVTKPTAETPKKPAESSKAPEAKEEKKNLKNMFKKDKEHKDKHPIKSFVHKMKESAGIGSHNKE